MSIISKLERLIEGEKRRRRKPKSEQKRRTRKRTERRADGRFKKR